MAQPGAPTGHGGTAKDRALLYALVQDIKTAGSRKAARNSFEGSFNKHRKRCNSNDAHSRFEIVAGELRAKFVSVNCGARGRRRLAGLRADAPSHTSAIRRRRCGGRRRDRRAWLRRPWAVAGPGQATHRHPDRLEAAARPAGPGRASSRRAERSSRRGRRAGGQAARRPEICRGNKQHQRSTDTETTKRAGTPRFRPALNAQQQSARDVRQ